MLHDFMRSGPWMGSHYDIWGYACTTPPQRERVSVKNMSNRRRNKRSVRAIKDQVEGVVTVVPQQALVEEDISHDKECSTELDVSREYVVLAGPFDFSVLSMTVDELSGIPSGKSEDVDNFEGIFHMDDLDMEPVLL